MPCRFESGRGYQVIFTALKMRQMGSCDHASNPKILKICYTRFDSGQSGAIPFGGFGIRRALLTNGARVSAGLKWWVSGLNCRPIQISGIARDVT